MIKKFTFTISVLLFLFILTACDGDLSKYKNDAKIEISDYVAVLNEEDYTSKNWSLIEKEAADGKIQIDNAKSKKEVGIIKETVVSKIADILKETRVAVSFEEVLMFFNHGDNLSIIIKSADELTMLITENEWLFVEPNKWIDFDDIFFENKALILHFAITPSVSVSYLLDDIQIVGNNLKIYLVGQHYGDEMLDMEGFLSAIAIVHKSDINNITSFDINIRYENLVGTN